MNCPTVTEQNCDGYMILDVSRCVLEGKLMYTENTEKEMQFLIKLLYSHDIDMANGDTVPICECPYCHKGMVLCHCTVGEENGYMSWQYRHICDVCGEEFDINAIQSDIFFHTAYKQETQLATPFGEVCVTANGRKIPFHHRKDTYQTTDEAFEKTIEIDIIDIDLSNFKVEDLIWCGFHEDILEFNDSDERSVLYSCEDEKHILGLCAFEPDDGDDYCYSLCDFSGNGFYYRIEEDPHNFDEKKFYKSKYASLAVACLDKADFEDANTELFCALTCVIG